MKKNKYVSFAILLLLSMSASLAILPNASAHFPPIQIPTYAFCNVSPSPIGAGQFVYVNFWLHMPPPTANAQYGDRWHNMTLVVTNPEGTTKTIGTYTSDAVGGSHITYTPTEIGTYTFKMTFAGQTITGENPAPGSDPSTNPFFGDHFLPSESNVATLVVQQKQITFPAETQLPTNYWTRPIYAENNNWFSIASNWLGLGQSTFAYTGMYDENGNYNPYTTAPNAAHILWTKPVAFGGTMGGKFGGSEISNFYSTSQYEPKFAPIIINGIIYYTGFPGASTNPAGWTAINLRTGQTVWTKNTTEILRCGQVLYFVSPNQYGGIAYLWSSPKASQFGGIGSSLEMWDAMTGNYVLTITNITVGYYLYLTTDNQGNLLGYYINSTDNTLNMWNSTRCINIGSASGPVDASQAYTWSWRPKQDAVIDFGLGIQWSKPVATEISGAPLIDYSKNIFGLTITAVTNDVVLMEESDSTTTYYQSGWSVEAGYSATDGHQLWIANRTFPAYSYMFGNTLSLDFGNWMGSGAYVDISQATNTIYGFNLNTGEKLWGPIDLPNARPFSVYGANAQVANGIIYIWRYGGDVYAYNILTGELKWQYHTPDVGYESPYGTEPLWVFSVGTVADGKLFIAEGHAYSPPLFRKAQQLALDITDGSVVWSIDAFDVTSAPAIVDGTMVTLNAYDNQLYAFGKGPTRLTVDAPMVGVTTKIPVAIRGTITDISAGTKQDAQSMNFPNGLPCVSDDGQTAWMEYVYMQQPMPTDATGVTVKLTITDSSGTTVQTGTATSDTNGNYVLSWTPTATGTYKVTATFGGTNSYYGSNSETHLIVASASGQTATTSESPFAMYTLIAVVILVMLAIIAIILLLRKK